MDLYKFRLPNESNSVIAKNVEDIRMLEGNLRKIFYKYSCKEVLMPIFEYVNLYKSVYKNLDESLLFKFINKDGEDIVLRYDFTVPIARYFFSQKKDESINYCYFGKVFRKEKELNGKNSEIYQAGVELIGWNDIDGDIKCLSLLKETLPLFGLPDLKIELGSARFYNRLCELIGIERKDEFSNLLFKKNISGLRRFCEKYQIENKLRSFVESLPRLNGNVEVLKNVIDTIQDDELRDSMIELEELYERMKMKEQDLFDLACVPSMDYYTGIIFKVYDKHVEEPIISGGRYDRLMDNFGKDVPAIGMAYYMDNIIKAKEKAGEENC